MIVCEGETDKVILAHLVQRLLSTKFIERRVEIVPAQGKAIIPRMVRALEARLSPPSIAIVIDSDGNKARTWSTVGTKLPKNKYSIVMAHPNVESWVTTGGSKPRMQPATFTLAHLAEIVDLAALQQLHPEFSDLVIAVTTVRHP
jgi:hypothetical protein